MCCDREDTYLKQHEAMMAVAASHAVQLEVDRFSLATSLLAVAARAHCGLPCAVTPLSPPEVLGATPPDSVKAKFEKQVGCLLSLCLQTASQKHIQPHPLARLDSLALDVYH